LEAVLIISFIFFDTSISPLQYSTEQFLLATMKSITSAALLALATGVVSQGPSIRFWRDQGCESDDPNLYQDFMLFDADVETCQGVSLLYLVNADYLQL